MAEELHNDSSRPLQVPGFNNYSLYTKLRDEKPSFTRSDDVHGFPLTAREVVMLQVMNHITDKLDWHHNLLDVVKVNEWRDEISRYQSYQRPYSYLPLRTASLVSDKAWGWCLAELRDRAQDFEATGRVLVFNGRSGICKSDAAVPAQLQTELRDGVAKLLTSSDIERDGQCNAESAPSIPTRRFMPLLGGRVRERGRGRGRGRRVGRASGETSMNEPGHNAQPSGVTRRSQVIKHIDPSLFPLVYGKTRVMSDRDGSSLSECLNYSGCGHVATTTDPHAPNSVDDGGNGQKPSLSIYKKDDRAYFSWCYQRLPCEVEFTESSGVKITSYINNLHPTRFKAMYSTIEKLITAAVPPWNEILVKNGSRRSRDRVQARGVDWSTKANDGWPSSEVLSELEKDRSSESFKSMVYRIRDYLHLPDQNQHPPDRLIFRTSLDSDDWEWQLGGLKRAIFAKWERLRQWEHPEPGDSFSYAEWKAENTANAKNRQPETSRFQDHEFNPVSLTESFRMQGLQVIVKMVSLELTSEDASYESTEWVHDGMLNDHIAATAICYYDIQNCTMPGLSFRQLATIAEEDLKYNDDLPDALAAIFGVSSADDMLASFEYAQECSGYQTIGSVSTPQGRLVAWPSTLQHKFHKVQLVDESKPGYARYVVLSLVDPYYRICSTRNVRPQRHDWWYDEAVQATGMREKDIPQEIIDVIGGHSCDWPMGMEEAKILREEMVEEFQDSMHKRSCRYRPL